MLLCLDLLDVGSIVFVLTMKTLLLYLHYLSQSVSFHAQSSPFDPADDVQAAVALLYYQSGLVNCRCQFWRFCNLKRYHLALPLSHKKINLPICLLYWKEMSSNSSKKLLAPYC